MRIFDPWVMNTNDASLSGGVASKSMEDNQLLFEVMFLVLVEKKGRLIGCGRI